MSGSDGNPRQGYQCPHGGT